MIPILSNLLTGGAGELINSVGNVLDKVVTTKGEKMGLENELKKADQQFQVDMKKLSVEEQQMVFQDIDSARKREMQIQTSPNATKLSKNVSPILALGSTILTLTLFFILVFRPDLIEEKSKEILMYILGVLSAILSQVFGYYFGSSQGSADKSKTIQQQLQAK